MLALNKYFLSSGLQMLNILEYYFLSYILLFLPCDVK